MNAARTSILALILCWAFAAMANVAVPPLTGRVVDKTATLSSSDVASLDQTLKAFEARKGSQLAVLIVPTTQPEAIEQYSLRVAETWKIGRKKIDDGAILVVAKDDRKLRIEVGYGLEGALTDVTARRIIDEVITPKFRGGDFAGGISAGVDRIIRIVDGEPLPVPAQPRQDTGLLSQLDPFNPFLIVAVIVVGGILRGILGRLFGSLATGGLVAVLFWFIAASLALSVISGIIAFFVTMFSDAMTSSGGAGRGGGWISGGGGYSGAGSSGGGFSGGGGSFGGGGASGSW
ncbi:TPM domain-containing protein [uncultured Bradyrhizobium sp.]|uniref:TPM domain-containing protein n=1 Tax=uncultured Bradyrhizobium sp. TaxID=199684 RepID=UPI0035CC39E0